jgi:hypothetical protein
MLMASTTSTDGRGFPTDIGEPSNFKEFPLKDTCVPGWDEAQSIGILGWGVAQPKVRNTAESAKNTKNLFESIRNTSFFLNLMIHTSEFNKNRKIGTHPIFLDSHVLEGIYR